MTLRRRRIVQEGSVINNYRILLPVLQHLGLYYMNSFATVDNGGFIFISPAKATEFVCAPPSLHPFPRLLNDRLEHLCVHGSLLSERSFHNIHLVSRTRLSKPRLRSFGISFLETSHQSTHVAWKMLTTASS